MTNKTAIDALKIAREALRERRTYCSEWEYKYSKEWDNEDGFIQGAIEKLTALEADKPAEDAEEVAISIANLFSAYTLRNGKHLPASVEAAQLLMHFAEAHHAKRCQICHRNELPDFARFENRSSGTTDVDK